ncbi:hypothetical protein [Nocardiopsis potens]|uniref:hypothetical protein n=1 Tax=Nocardiopsis potens TaxID=1246458 RepID=UPI000345F2B9|nr:hypothetical protein [Nocardiopsis potens]
MFELLFPLTGLACGIGIAVAARRSGRARAAIDARERRRELAPLEAERERLGVHRAALRLGWTAVLLLLALLGAALGNAALTGDWTGRTLYYAVLLLALLAWSGYGLLVSREQAERSRRRIDALG